ncbi:hypothetical protein CPB84DRAFT_1538140 [Gymnopilus junonius]|uniref:Uncharacterized protein n=1 Tax=Gymnopilus junonius TaxID=109634 RepID=A0A9P5NIA0_GYMJU|nr:hypothetical protein CPB84DRAFT_1538140 [Gymnopilus junonius]
MHVLSFFFLTLHLIPSSFEQSSDETMEEPTRFNAVMGCSLSKASGSTIDVLARIQECCSKSLDINRKNELDCLNLRCSSVVCFSFEFVGMLSDIFYILFIPSFLPSSSSFSFSCKPPHTIPHLLPESLTPNQSANDRADEVHDTHLTPSIQRNLYLYRSISYDS